ncbi:hypothetical protein RTBOTA2_003682 [Rhodotorula toruloides]|uniref:Uncharacterized protein n=1 Tax=Rhodotorula toruloides TaxID=5286 RepID=A0A0K3CCE7_RHOTO|nr:hypothetical protein RTBOTA2_003682 [Rhodotorula toruloides]PRQ76341.1 hypothetical protein AAT19DRAFT_13363 [Rhodotorula toruloides]
MSASPAPAKQLSPSPSTSASTPVVPAKKGAEPPQKPRNLFSNDGSFLERFKKNAVPTADQEKKEREEVLARKKALEERFKKRGKRHADSTADAPAGKKKKDDEEGLTEYQKEVRRLEARTLKDEGYGSRALLK